MTTQFKSYFAFIGTYTRPPSKSEGIYVYRFDPATGGLSYISKATGINNPSFVALHPGGRFLYAVAEIADAANRTGGGVTAYAIDRATGSLRKLNEQSTKTAGPCHVAVDATGKFAVVANYHGGAVTVLPLNPDGSLGEASDFIQHGAASKHDPRRQETAHAHSATIDSSNRFAIIADLGGDKVYVYRLNLSRGIIEPNSTPWTPTALGAGPRHFDFHPNGKYAYVINELGNTVMAFNWDAEKGTLTEFQTVNTLPAGWSGSNSTADVHVHPSGRWLYGSNRGHDSIAMYSIDEKSGRLSSLGQESSKGKTPRNFAIDPTGQWLLAENQDSDSIVTFKIDQKTGRLAATGAVTDIPMPVCLKFLAAG
jgi:6-phosphogluconolactonase